MKKEILKLTGLTEAEFYKRFPTQEAFENAYPGYKKKLGGLTEAFPQIATADNFFSYGVPVPPTYYMHGGPTVYPQIQTDAQFFSPVYSNSNNAYAVGGSYIEEYPQAKRYPQGPVGGSSFYMMQDGGSSMQEPTKDQTFYTQKMNDFFDKLRQASYKNMMNGVMNSEDQSADDMGQLALGKYGGLPSFQGNQTSGQTNTGTTTTTPNYQTVTTADGQTYIVGPNNQLYSPFKGNQTTTTNTQQQAYNPYPYRNSNGVYVGTGLDSVANWLIPNNQREQYRNIREQQGLGIGDLTPEQLKAIQSGAANVADISYETRRALFPKNRIKSVNIKFRNPVTGQIESKTDPASAAATNPAATTNSTTTPTTTNSTSTTATTPGSTAANPASTTTTTNPAATTANTTNTATTPTSSTTSPAATTSSTKDVNAVVAQMQADARAKGMSNASFEGDYSDEDLMPADERAAIKNQQSAIDAEFQNYENYKKFRGIQERLGMTPDEYNYNQVYDYGTQQAVSPTATAKPVTPSAASTTPTTTSVRKSPAKINSTDDTETKRKKKGYNNPNTYINQDFINATRNQARGANGLPPVNITAPADTMDTTTWPGVYAAPGTPKFDGSENPPYRMGGPYVLPMYQGAVGPSQIDEEAFGPYANGLGEAPQESMDPSMSPYGPYADKYRFEPEQDEFEVGLNFGKTKKKGVNPYTPAMIRGLADYINKTREGQKGQEYLNKMSRADQVFNTFDQFRGDYAMNTPAGANFRPDQMVPVGYTGAGYKEGPVISQYGGPMMFDVADLFFLTPQMLKKTRGRG